MTATAETAAGIGATNARFMECFKARDAAGMAALYTDTGQLMPGNSDFVTGAEAIAGFWQAVMEMGIAGARLETVELDDLGDTAIEVGRYTLTTADGQTADQGKFLVVWKHDGGTWKLHRDIWNTSLPPATG